MVVRYPHLRSLPRLANGDRLTAKEFHARYEAMPEVKNAELIEGEVFMASPVSFDYHAEPHGIAVTWAGVYCSRTPSVTAGDNTTVKIDDHNEPQPDVCLFLRPGHGGQVEVVNGYIEGVPELVFEISGSSASLDMNRKLEMYRRHGVQEYIVWRVYDDAIDWFHSKDTQLEKVTPDADGILKSQVFPGLWLDATAMLNRDLSTVLGGLEKGLQTEDHKAFARIGN